MTNYHYRNLYEWQYECLCIENGIEPEDVVELTDFQLLLHINTQLKKLGCIPFTRSEMFMELA